ncbi:hypothetical protein [Streptomyces sp. NPDC127098]|uniref:hypothetical protein n=1 Tax=Streptomyces sp. NPDC127098 TaxID=3347137 RepID=UPI0036470571
MTPARVRPLVWLGPIGVNAVLGIVAVVPLFLLWYFLVNYPLHDLGLTSREPTENDGVGVVLVMLAVVWAWFLAVWFLANVLVRKGTPARELPGRRYWTASATMPLVPTLVLVLWSEVDWL